MLRYIQRQPPLRKSYAMVAIVIHAFLLDQFEPRHVVRDLTFRIIIPMDKKLEALGLRAVLDVNRYK